MSSPSRVATRLLIRSRQSHHSRIRAFSSFSRHQKFMPPPYPPTTSPELDELLQTIRRKVLLPKFLDPMQRAFVGSPTNRQSLIEEDIRVVIGEIEERLEPFDVTKDYASMRDTFARALELSLETGDFSFWASLMRGYSSAGYKYPNDLKERFVRKAMENDRLRLVMSLVEAVNRTGFTLSTYLTTIIAVGIRNQALLLDQLYMVENDLPDTDQPTKDSLIVQIKAGDDGAKTAELSSIRAKAFHRGLTRSVKLNYVVSMDKNVKSLAQDENSLLGGMTLSEPSLIALPLELQSRLQKELKKAPNALSSPASNEETTSKSDTPTPESALPPRPQLKADDYAKRLIKALTKEPIDLQKQLVPVAADAKNSTKHDAANVYRNKLTRAFLVAASLREARGVIEDAELAKQVSGTQQSIETQMRDVNVTGLENYLGFDYWKEYQARTSSLPTR